MITALSKSFTTELRDLYPGDQFTRVTVFYDGGDLCPQPIRDEFGREWDLKDMSIYDIQVVQKNLILHLVADENREACGMPEDSSDEFDRAFEIVTNFMERGAI